MSALPPKSPATVAPFSDALGYRVLGFDKKSGDRLEMLRLRPQLASAPAFEAAVRERQRRLVDFRHAAYTRVRQIDRPAGQNAALAIVSNYADGQRLSELLRAVQASAVPMELIVGMCLLQQMVTAVAQLHALGPDLSHGALNPERLVVTPAGRVVITEYVAGAGLASLGLTPQQAWQDYRLALPPDGSEPFGQASDVYQLGYLGLTLVSGRSIYDRQYPPPFATLLNGAEEIGTDGRTQPLHPAIVSWLTRALRLGGPFASAVDAQASLDEAIASAGLVATPDVVADLVTRAAGETDAEPATMISMPVPLASTPAATAPPAADLPAPKAAIETPWTPAAAETPAPVARRESGSHQAYVAPVVRRDSGSHQAYVAPVPEPAAELPVLADAPPADLDLPMHAETPAPAPAESELPPAQAWTPKKETSREVKAVRPASSSNALLGHDSDSHAAAEKSGSSKALVIGGGLAAVAAIAAVVVFVVKPFGGAGTTAPPQVASMAATGTVSIDSTPRARVFIDESPRGTTPLRLDLSTGVHRVRVEADGGLTKTFEVNVLAGKEVSQVVELTKPAPDRAATAAAAAAASAALTTTPPPAPNPGFMTVEAPEELQLLEDGRPLGSSASGKVALEPGSHLIEFRNDSLGFQATRTVQVLPGKTVRVSIPLPEGGLSINATPWAEVMVDGRPLGETPIANVTLRAGTHEIVFRHPQHGELKQTVVVKAGENGRVTVNMAR